MRVFVDGGAHAGETFEWVPREAFDKVFLIEPNWKFWDQIKHLGDLCQFALWDGDGLAPFYASLRTDLGDSLLSYKGDEPMDAEHPSNTRVVDAARWLEENTSPDDIVTVKLDIEGAEYRVLDRLLSHPVAGRIKRMMVEWHPIPGLIERKPDLLARMEELGIVYEEWPY